MDTNEAANNRAPMPLAFFGIAVGALALAGAWSLAAHTCGCCCTACQQRALTFAALAV